VSESQYKYDVPQSIKNARAQKGRGSAYRNLRTISVCFHNKMSVSMQDTASESTPLGFDFFPIEIMKKHI